MFMKAINYNIAFLGLFFSANVYSKWLASEIFVSSHSF